MELSPRDQIRVIGQSLAIGFTDNKTLCVYCEGGETKELSFAVTRQDRNTVAYKCHRASCDKGGYVYLDGGAGEEVTKVRVFTPNPYRGQTVALEYEDLAFLDERYGLDLEYVIRAGWVRAVEPGFALAMPVISPLGALRGLIVKRKLEDGRKYVNSYRSRTSLGCAGIVRLLGMLWLWKIRSRLSRLLDLPPPSRYSGRNCRSLKLTRLNRYLRVRSGSR